MVDPIVFPLPVLTVIHGKPGPTDIRLLRREVYGNAKSVPSLRGGGQNGHLALVMNPADYLLQPGAIAFVAPIHPGIPPVHGANATQAQINAAETVYDRAIKEFDVFAAVKIALANQLLAAVDKEHVEELEHDTFGYGNVTPLDFMQHFTDNFYEITADHLETNRTILSSPWNPDDDIATLLARISRCKKFAVGSTNPITDEVAMNLTTEALRQSGVMERYIDEWERKEPAAQTLALYKTFYTKADKARRKTLTSRDAGYQAAFHATPSTPTTPVVAPALANAATRVDNAAVCVDNLVTMFYCHTHGLGTNPNHTSRTCSNPADNHDAAATVTNMRGGNDRISAYRPTRTGTTGRGGRGPVRRGRNNSPSPTPPTNG